MEIARLQTVLDASQARTEARSLKAELSGIGDEAEKMQSRGQSAMGGLATAAKLAGKSGVGELRKEMEQAEKETISWAQSTARLQAAQGNLAAAVNTLQFALNGAKNVTTQYIAAQTQLTQLQAQLARGGGVGGGNVPTGGGGSIGGGGFGSATTQLLSFLAAYLSVQQAMRAGDELVRTQILFENLDLSLRAITHSAETAQVELSFLRMTTDRLGTSFRESIPEFTKIIAAFSQSGIGLKQTEQLFTDISISTRALGLSTATTNRVLYDMQEMASLGTVQLRQLRQMIMQVPGGLDVAARAAGVTTEEFHRLVHEGMIPANEFLPIFAAELRKTFGSEVEAAANSTESHVNRISNAWLRLKKELAERLPIPQALSLFGAGIGTISDAMEADRALPKDSSYRQKIDKLKELFPYATPPEMPPQGDTAGDQYARRGWSWQQNYLRMRDENDSKRQTFESDRSEWEKAHQMVDPSSPIALGNSASDIPEEQKQNWQKLIDLQQKFYAEGEQGLQKQLADIERNYQAEKQKIDELFSKPPFSVFHPGKGYDTSGITSYMEQFGNPYEDAANSRDSRRSQAVQADELKRSAKEAEDLTRQYRELKTIQDQIDEKGQPTRRLSELAEANRRYREQYNTLIAIDEEMDVSQDTFEKLNQSHQHELELIEQKYAKTFVGEKTVTEMFRERLELQRKLLAVNSEDEEGADQARRIQNEIRAREQAMQLKMQTDQTSASDAFIYGWQRAADRFGSLSERIASVSEGLSNEISNNMTNALMDWIQGTKSAEQAFADMARAIVAELLKIMIQQLIVKAILSAFGSIGGMGGGGGGSFPTGSTAGGTWAHGGGVMGASPSGGNISALAFAGAPRFHTGGVIGDEIPIIARRREVMFTPEQMGVIGDAIKGGGDKGRSVEIINITDLKMIDEHLATRGEGTILNIIARNRPMLKKMLQ